MFARISRLFVIKTRLEAFMVIYALALGAAERGRVYLDIYPGLGGRLLFLACLGSVMIAGAKILDCVRYEQQLGGESLAERRSAVSRFGSGRSEIG
jgi:hypothetical protein